MNDEKAFWRSVIKFPGGCWIWVGDAANYGRFGIKGRKVYAHRYSYELAKGPIPGGLVIDHLCREPYCVNPDHLEAVTQYENIHRSDTCPSAVNARLTHCLNGHNLAKNSRFWVRSDGSRKRICKLCHKTRQEEYNKKKSLNRPVFVTKAKARLMEALLSS